MVAVFICGLSTSPTLTAPCRVASAVLNRGVNRCIPCQCHRSNPVPLTPPIPPNKLAVAGEPLLREQGTLLRNLRQPPLALLFGFLLVAQAGNPGKPSHSAKTERLPSRHSLALP